LETWLLALRGHQLNAASPEHYYNRSALKRFFFGKPMPPVQERTQMALAALARPNAMAVLLQRRSFQRFASDLNDWP